MPDGPLAPDLTAPAITNIVVSNVTSANATISFNTDELSTGWVSYSLTGSCPCTDVFDPAIGMSHTITLTNLAANTTYTFQVHAHDAANNSRRRRR
jgi:chitodextrinase